MLNIVKFTETNGVIFKIDPLRDKTAEVTNLNNLPSESRLSHIADTMSKLGWTVAQDLNTVFCAKRRIHDQPV